MTVWPTTPFIDSFPTKLNVMLPGFSFTTETATPFRFNNFCRMSRRGVGAIVWTFHVSGWSEGFVGASVGLAAGGADVPVGDAGGMLVAVGITVGTIVDVAAAVGESVGGRKVGVLVAVSVGGKVVDDAVAVGGIAVAVIATATTVGAGVAPAQAFRFEIANATMRKRKRDADFI